MSSGQVDLGVDEDFQKKESICTNTHVAREHFWNLRSLGIERIECWSLYN